MKKILILFAIQFALLPQIIRGNNVNQVEDYHQYLVINQGKQTIKKNVFGNTIVEDNSGNRKIVKKNLLGNTIIEDNAGNRTIIKKDIFGNTIIENY